jgi:hypothetical protein
MRRPVSNPTNVSKSAPLPGSGIYEYEKSCEQSYKCEQKCSFTWIWKTWVWEVLWAVLQMWAKVLLYLDLENLSMRRPVSSPTNVSKSAPTPDKTWKHEVIPEKINQSLYSRFHSFLTVCEVPGNWKKDNMISANILLSHNMLHLKTCWYLMYPYKQYILLYSKQQYTE